MEFILPLHLTPRPDVAPEFTTNGGRSEIVHDCAGVKIEKLFEGCTHRQMPMPCILATLASTKPPHLTSSSTRVFGRCFASRCGLFTF